MFNSILGSLKEDHKSNLQVSQSLPPFWHNQTTRSYPRLGFTS